MQIFNIEINGIDAERFCAKPLAEKVAWIKANTYQQNEDKILTFLSEPPRQSAGCGCGGFTKPSKWDYANISQRISPEVTSVPESLEIGIDGSGDSEPGRTEPEATETKRTRKGAKARR